MDPTTFARVLTKQGELRGKIDVNRNGGQFYSFYSIPYAKPPIGELRFKAPQPPEPWIGVRDALVENSGCYARHTLRLKEFVGQEDCLYLNVYTQNLPEGKPDKKLLKPVMFFIHGGSYCTGSGRTELYGPDNLMTEDIVLVTINYRLGILGFMSFHDPELNIPGNAGLKDMVLALKWVQNNIANFNGDPNNVTVFGQSAGGASTHLLMLSSLTKGLFHRAIPMSGTALNSWAFGDCGVAEPLAKALKMSSTSERDVYEKLKDMSLEKLLELQDICGNSVTISKKLLFCPVRESGRNNEPTFIRDNPTDIIRSGNYNKIPLMIGHTNNEGIYMEFFEKQLDGNVTLITDFEKAIPWHLRIPRGTELSKNIATKIKIFYYGDATPSKNNMSPFYDMSSDTLNIVDMYRMIKEHMATLGQPIYMYVFSGDTKLNMYKILAGSAYTGASHGDDLGYLFKSYVSPEIKPGTIEHTCSARSVKLWTNFAKSGNPTPDPNDPLLDNIKWNPLNNPDRFEYMNIGNEISMNVNPYQNNFQFWKEIYDIQPDKIHH